MDHPNVLYVRVTHENQEDIASIVYEWLESAEKETLVDLARRFENAAVSQDREVLGAHAQYFLDGDYTDSDLEVLAYKPEREYYQGIRSQLLGKIAKEIAGENEFVTPQDPQKTRRFVYAHDSCISMINCLIRDKRLSVFIVLRSSNTRDTLSYDLRFIATLISEAETFFGPGIDERVMHISIHSAHIIN